MLPAVAMGLHNRMQAVHMPLNSQGVVAHVKHFNLLQPLLQQQHLGNAG